MIVNTFINLLPKDLEKILGFSEDKSKRIYQTIKFNLKKEEEKYITVQDLCEFLNLEKEEVYKKLNIKK